MENKVFNYIEKEIIANLVNKEQAKYTEIVQKLSNDYNFSDEKIIKLFRYCKSKDILHRNYILSVANSWRDDIVVAMTDFNFDAFKELETYSKNVKYSKDAKEEIKITKAEAKNGTVKDIVVHRASPNIEEPGDFLFNKEIEKVIIPRNTKENAIIELKGKGNQYTTDEIRGNLYVKIHIFGK